MDTTVLLVKEALQRVTGDSGYRRGWPAAQCRSQPRGSCRAGDHHRQVVGTVRSDPAGTTPAEAVDRLTLQPGLYLVEDHAVEVKKS